jgi:carotenoid 1,2-hydratase
MTAGFHSFSSRADDVWHAGDGYEWWYFDALSDDRRDLLVVIFLAGFVFSPRYNRAWAAGYAPRPQDFPALAATLYRDGRPLWRAINEFTAADFSADQTTPAGRIGNSRFRLDGDVYRLELDAVLRGDRRVTGSFGWEIEAGDFTPAERSAGGVHAWNLVAPRCRVAGAWRVEGRDAGEFRGAGYHDHNADTRWLPATVETWDWGRAHFAGDTTTVFYRYREHGADEAGYLFLIDKNGWQIHPASFAERAARRHRFGLRYPNALEITARDAPVRLTLARRRVVDGSFFYLRLQDRATLADERAATLTAPAVSEHLAPRALRCRWLDWLVNMRIGRRGRGAFLP